MASKVVELVSAAQLDKLAKSNKLVVVAFVTLESAPCRALAPVFEKLAAQLARDGVAAFARADADALPDLAQRCHVTTVPTCVFFRDGAFQEQEQVESADPGDLEARVTKLLREAEAEAGGEPAPAAGSAAGREGGLATTAAKIEAALEQRRRRAREAAARPAVWTGASVPRGYKDITDKVDVARTELLNVDDRSAGGVRVLFAAEKPSGAAEAPAAAEGAGAGAGAGAGDADWVESDTDEQLMLFVPLQSVAKVHTLQLTAHATETAARPAVLRLYSNSPHNLGFDEAEDMQATQEVVLKPTDWNEQATASIPLRFVKFQNVTSLVVFVVAAEDGADRVRLDRVRLVGEAGEAREMGKLQKIEDAE